MRMPKIAKKAISFALILCLALTSVISVSACTGFYLGKDLTENGSTIWGRTEDVSASFSKLYVVRPAATHEPGEMWDGGNGFTYPYPEKTLRYTIAPDSVFNEGYANDPYGEVGMNEKNVAITATVTLSGAKSAITAIDPFVRANKGGISEQTVASIILMQATSARHAVEVYGNAVETYGSAARDGITISDPNEVWYMEVVSGHQYVAVKAPSDKIGVSPNITMMGAVDVTDTENVIASPGLVQVAQDAGTLVTDDQGRIKVAESYANPNNSVPSRLYDGMLYLKGKSAADALTGGYYQYFVDGRPEGNYTLFEAMRLLTQGSINRTGTVEANVFETRYNMPDELAIVKWLAMGPAIYSVYLPYYGSLITDTYESYWNADSKTFNENSFYWVFRQINKLCTANAANTERYGKNITKFWGNYQQKLIEQQKDIDNVMISVLAQSPELAQEKATALGKALAKEAFENAKIILNELQAFINAGTEGDFTPSLLTKNVLPNYTFDAIGGAGLPEITVANGKQLTVPITLRDCTNLSGLNGVVKYDSNLLKLVDITGTNGFTLTRKGNKFNVATGDLNLSGDLVVGHAIFLAKENLDDDYTTYVTFPKDKMSAYNNLTETIDVNPQAVQVKVLSEPLLPGDVDLDGKVSLSDAILLLQYLSQSTTLTSKQLRAADVAGDGLVNTADAVVIMQMSL